MRARLCGDLFLKKSSIEKAVLKTSILLGEYLDNEGTNHPSRVNYHKQLDRESRMAVRYYRIVQAIKKAGSG